jgi:hypothetical protein
MCRGDYTGEMMDTDFFSGSAIILSFCATIYFALKASCQQHRETVGDVCSVMEK